MRDLPVITERERLPSPAFTPKALAWHQGELWFGSRDLQQVYQECDSTLCCDTSPNRHSTKHAHATGHPVIASAEPNERWLYCYPDDAFSEY